VVNNMSFRIADTFTESLADLSADEQKQVKLTVYDLLVDPSAPGLRLHRLEHAKDKGFWSARVNDGLRVITHRRGDDMLLCYAGHHDRAYPWAERRKVTEHTGGAITFVEVQHKAHTVNIPVYHDQVGPGDACQALLKDVVDDTLRDLGVPEQLFDKVRAATEEDLLSLCTYLTPDTADSLFDLAAAKTGPVREYAGGNPAEMYLESLGQSSVRSMRGAVELLVAAFDPECTVSTYPWHALNFKAVETVITAIKSKGYAPKYVYRIFSALRGVVRFAYDLGIVGPGFVLRCVAATKLKAESVRGRAVSSDDLKRLLAVCDTTTAMGLRDAAALSLGFECGIRAASLVRVQMSDLLAGDSLRVQGVHGSERVVALAPSVLARIEAWLNVRGRQPGCLFFNTQQHYWGSPITPTALSCRFRALSELARVPCVFSSDIGTTRGSSVREEFTSVLT
jgi:site-specific recombinase XerC